MSVTSMHNTDVTTVENSAMPPSQLNSDPPPKSIQPNAEQNEGTMEQTELESNQDYQMIVKVLSVLKHQLTRATKDIETLKQLKEKALDDPMGFVLDLKSKRRLKRAPPLQKIVTVPELDWTKYRFIPESRFAKQTASLAYLTQQYTGTYRKPGMYKTVMDMTPAMTTPATSIQRQGPRTPRTTSAEVKLLQQELTKGLEAINQIPSRGGSAAVSDTSDSDDGPSTSLFNGKGKRRVSSQTGTVDKTTHTPIISQSSSVYERPPSSSSNTSTKVKSKATMAAHEVPTHNQPWTDEEQQRLEQLLEIYPDEPVQAQRFNKIAQALGTRTARQVGSRIQKYFMKLAKMGLPVPGRVNLPASQTTSKQARVGSGGRGRGRGRSRMKSMNRKLRTSGMGYNSIISGGLTSTKVSGGYYSTAAVPTVYMDDDDNMDNKVKETMLRVANPAADDEQNNTGTDTVIHEGYACDSCGVEPIVGVLYKCTVCDEAEEVDLCSKCMSLGTFSNDQHSADHVFEAIRVPAAPYYADDDYASPEHLGEYSYLGFQ